MSHNNGGFKDLTKYFIKANVKGVYGISWKSYGTAALGAEEYTMN